MMSGKGLRVAALVFLAAAVVFFLSGCNKLKVSKLQANFHFSKANGAYTDGHFRNAITEYEAALRLNPELHEAYHFLGEAYKNLYRPGVETEDNIEKANKALESLRKAYEYFPKEKQIIYSLGDMYDKMRNFEEAEKFYLKILELEPGNMDNYYVVAEFYKRYAGRSEEDKQKEGEGEKKLEGKNPLQKAEEMYLRRIEADPENPQGYSYMARFYELPPFNDFDKAKGLWEKLIQLQPNSADAWYSKGANRWAKAYRVPNISKEERLASANEGIECLKKAIELDPEYPEPYSWMSVIYESVLAQLEPDKANRYKAEAVKARERWEELKKRAAARQRLEEELKK